MKLFDVERKNYKTNPVEWDYKFGEMLDISNIRTTQVER